MFGTPQNVSDQQKSSIGKTVAVGQTTSIRAMLPLLFPLALLFLSIPLPPRFREQRQMGIPVSAFPAGSADGYASSVSAPVGVCANGFLCREEERWREEHAYNHTDKASLFSWWGWQNRRTVEGESEDGSSWRALETFFWNFLEVFH